MNDFLREQRITTVGLASVVIAPGNVKRRAIIIGAPALVDALGAEANANVAAADTGTGGVKLTSTPSAGKVRTLVTATASVAAAGAAPVLSFGFFDGTNFIVLATGAPPITFTAPIKYSGAETLRWQVTTVGAGSTTNFGIFATEQAAQSRITLSFAGPAILDQGLNIFPGNAPLILAVDIFGRALREEITAISSLAGATVGVIDIMDG